MSFVVPVSESGVEFEAEPCLSLEFIYGFVVVLSRAVPVEESSRIMRALEEDREADLSMLSLWTVDEVNQHEMLIYAA